MILIKTILAPNIVEYIKLLVILIFSKKGSHQPPKNKPEFNAAIINILLYSLKKNSAKGKEE
jgi:hypothetical protein